jgi:HSP20 family molecular chaperone IbpA|tara:strand:- start:662 stop:997 length:336 start_codon:yes stop_codon:yes gene_type:complete
MNTLINSLFNGLNDLSPRDLMIRKKSCVADTGDVYVAEVELAGFSKKDISIRIVDGVVELDAKNKERSQKFKLHLNDLVAEDHISADLKNGLLKLTLPKKTVSEAREIQIK